MTLFECRPVVPIRRLIFFEAEETSTLHVGVYTSLVVTHDVRADRVAIKLVKRVHISFVRHQRTSVRLTRIGKNEPR